MFKIILVLLLIPFSLSAKVYSKNEWIALYLRNCEPGMSACRQELEKSFGRMQSYHKLVFKYLDKEGLPRWLATVPIIESDYNDKAVSPAKALGLWQIMRFNIKAWKTRKMKILGRMIEVVPSDKQIERYGFNPVTSTQLATRHLGKLYKRYSHHENAEELALMAYNAGGFRIDCQDPESKALIKRCKTMGIFKKPLTDETKNYYTKLMALQYIMKHSKQLKIKPVKHKRRFFFEYVKSLVRLEDDIKSDHAKSIIKEVLG